MLKKGRHKLDEKTAKKSNCGDANFGRDLIACPKLVSGSAITSIQLYFT